MKRPYRSSKVLTFLVLASVLALPVERRCWAQDANDSLYELNAAYAGEYWRAVTGGLERGGRYLDNVDLTASVDGAAWRMPQAEFYAHVLYNNGHAFNDELIGSAQGVSAIETIEALRLYELWGEWRFATLPISARFGLYDLNSEFDSLDAAGVFLNPSHGIGPDFAQTGANGPSIFPVTSLALRLRYAEGPWSVQVAAVDAVPGDADRPKRTKVRLHTDEGALLVAQVGYEMEQVGLIGLGYWRYTEHFEDLIAVYSDGSPVLHADNEGVYAIAETAGMSAGELGELRFFVRGGMANERTNPISRHADAGIVLTDRSAKNQWGVAVSVAHLGEPARQRRAGEGGVAKEYESIWEATYRRVIAADWVDHMAVQFDAQYVQHPNMDPTLADAWALGVRVEMGFDWRR